MIKNITDRAWVLSRIESKILGGYFRHFGTNDGMDVATADWDTLIILDACRYDTLKEVAPENWPPVECKKSRASNTWNFYKRNFCDGPYDDIVVVTAQPRTVQLRGDTFHEIIPVYNDDWDEELGTLKPSVMAQRTIEAHNIYPNKRILSHWVQPHYPFIGSDRFRDYNGRGESIWKDLKRGNVSATDKDVYQAYQATLEKAIPHVTQVTQEIDGRIVVSSDHGNVFGVRKLPYPFKIYGHPRDILIPELIDIPWVVFEGNKRRTVTETENSMKEIDYSVGKQLSDLGYLE